MLRLLGCRLGQHLSQSGLGLLTCDAVYLQPVLALELLDSVLGVAAEIAIRVQRFTIATNSAELRKLALQLLHLFAALALFQFAVLCGIAFVLLGLCKLLGRLRIDLLPCLLRRY
ncbi:hypothetical protein XEUV315_23420, partial [Xanthomonas euvesicatoria]